MSIGLILEGGASKGVFTAGVLNYLMEQKVEFPYVAGVSAGACNGLDYVAGQIGRTKDCMIPKTKEEHYFGFGQMRKSGRFYDIQRAFSEYPYELYPFDFETYFASDVINEIVVTNCHTGKAEYIREKKSEKRLLRASMASSSMPFFAPMIKLDGEYYLDGGIVDSIPLQRALDLGYEKNVVILTHNKFYRPRVSEGQMRLCRRKYRNYPKLIKAIEERRFMYLKQVALVRKLEKEGKVLVIRPQIPAVGRMESDGQKLEIFYSHGYEYMKEQYEKLCEFILKEDQTPTSISGE